VLDRKAPDALREPARRLVQRLQPFPPLVWQRGARDTPILAVRK
jgi:hypothetical protein